MSYCKYINYLTYMLAPSCYGGQAHDISMPFGTLVVLQVVWVK